VALRTGEKGILILTAVVVVFFAVKNIIHMERHPISKDPGIPFYSTATHQVARDATDLIRQEGCRDCHTLWATTTLTQFVPSPPLDGIGSLRSEDWLYKYFSAKDPQSILPSRLKPKYRMPSYAHLPEKQRRLLAEYMASLKVKNWYLKEVKKVEYEKLTGHPMVDAGKHPSR
jgi:L-cysteine S-thiosulfotransferase